MRENQAEVLVIAVPNGFLDSRKNLAKKLDKHNELAWPSRRFIEDGCGLPFGEVPDPYYALAEGFPVEFVEMRGQDIPDAVGDRQSGIHLGVTGKDRYDNKIDQLIDQIEIVRPFPFGRCEFTLGVPTSSDFFSAESKLEDLTRWSDATGSKIRVATGLEAVARKILDERHIDARIINIAGHVETAIRYNIAEVIMDLTETGGTMLRNGVTPAERLRSFYAVLIGKKGSLGDDLDLIKSWFLDRADIALANPSTWMTPKERQAPRNGESFLRPMLPDFSFSLPDPEMRIVSPAIILNTQIPA